MTQFRQMFGKSVKEEEAYKKFDFIQQYNVLFGNKEKDLEKIESGNVRIFIKWLSFNPENLDICEKLDKWHKYVDYDILVWLMYWKIDVSNKYIKFLKRVNNKYDCLKTYLCDYFKWSEREYYINFPLIKDKLEDKNVLYEFNNVFSLSSDECKILGILYEKVANTKVKKKVSSGASLFNFVKA